MLDWAKAIHEAIGIDSPRVFIATFALFGLLAFGFVGWIVDHGYRVKLREETVKAASPLSPPTPTPSPTTPSRTSPSVQSVAPILEPRSGPTIEQHSTGANSPNVATGDNSNVEIK